MAIFYIMHGPVFRFINMYIVNMRNQTGLWLTNTYSTVD